MIFGSLFHFGGEEKRPRHFLSGSGRPSVSVWCTRQDSNLHGFLADPKTPNTNYDSVSSISFVHVRDGKVIHKVSELLNPEQDFAAVNIQITGINSLIVKDKRKLPDFWREYGKEITSFPIVGHNVRFDIVVICKCLKHYGFTLNEVQYIDTMEMARDYLVLGNFGLDSVCQALNIPLAHHHNSLDDAMASEQIYSSLIESKAGLVAYIHVFDGDNSIRSHKSSLFKYSKQTEAYQFLKNMTDEILADNRITLKEIHKLDEWLDANEEFLAFYPFDRINASVKKALADNQISEEETQDLLQLFHEIDEPLGKSEEPEIIVPGKLFCLTGDFVKGKEAVSEELLAKDAMVKDTLTMKVNYLVVGSKGSEAWKYGNYGGKVA